MIDVMFHVRQIWNLRGNMPFIVFMKQHYALSN